MKNSFNKIAAAIIVGIMGFSALAFAPAFAANDASDNNNGGNGAATGNNSNTLDEIDACAQLGADSVARRAAGCDGGNTSDQFPNVIQGILNVIIGVSGVVAVIFIVVGGVNYMTSTGDPGKVKRAKDTILYACIGLVVCALAYAIVNWTIGAINKANTASSSTNNSTGDDNGGDDGDNS